ncbi:MAG TPA: polyphenol oxidase family protein [Acidimicrobiales bacterium]|nr:polyphenol oxidase family protein [Acidimicrobiales bacterium]
MSRPLERRVEGDVAGLTWPVLEDGGVSAVVTERGGGVSTGPYASLNLGLHVGDDPAAVVENRRRAAALVGAGLDDLVFCNQTHGREVVVVTNADRGRGARTADDAIPGADALVTTDPAVALVVMVADCVPIVLADLDARVLACVHAGWRGTVARVVEATVDVMVGEGARRDRILALLGPAVPPERYQVGPDVADAAAACFGANLDRVLLPDDTEAADDRWRFDLWTGNELLLRAAGIPTEHVSRAAAVPTGGDRFFSDRAVRPCGRFAAIARLHH